MDKEKEIQEMAHIVGKIKYGFFAGCEDESCGDCYIYRVGIDCGYLKQAEQLYLAGYRKADEVRRETAKKVLYELRDCFCEMTAYAVGEIVDEDYTEIGVTNVIDIIDEVLKKYGVEVD